MSSGRSARGLTRRNRALPRVGRNRLAFSRGRGGSIGRRRGALRRGNR